ncbi:hypothetical protein A1O3_08909 [Capronia epimyces CBS 606.96]|uniref:Uncharacterized protein n=1 Tax=Capronia epimyces CBS 606.96 TaxID=1182542 RepID=W9XG00_9EURO|nr:uncharacterized protein A1O3_08909 [Capronia epimyces CBS 606.96]EXJ79407.1 hypothetical protein A1O3_08909 [Capronia epimyces CBS 606.96]
MSQLPQAQAVAAVSENNTYATIATALFVVLSICNAIFALIPTKSHIRVAVARPSRDLIFSRGTTESRIKIDRGRTHTHMMSHSWEVSHRRQIQMAIYMTTPPSPQLQLTMPILLLERHLRVSGEI